MIDADKLKDEYRDDTQIGNALRMLVDMQPTAHDVDNVVEELKTTRIALEKANGCLEANWKLGYQKVIDNMVCSLIKNSTTEEIDGKLCLIVTDKRIKLVAEQLKAGV